MEEDLPDSGHILRTGVGCHGEINDERTKRGICRRFGSSKIRGPGKNRDASTYAETNVLTGIIQSGVTTVFVIKPIAIRHKFGNQILVQGENEISDLFFRA